MNKRIRLNERGVAQMVVVIVAIVVIAAVAVVGYTVANNHKDNSSSTSTNTATTKTAGGSCLATYHDNNLCKFAANSTSLAKTAYTATLQAVEQGKTSTMTLQNDGSGNTELTTTSAGHTISVITLNGNEYLQSSSGGPWIEYPTGTTEPEANPTSSMNIGVGKSGVTYKALGTAACGSLTCYKYKVTDSATPGATQYAYFDNSNYKLRKWQYSDGGNTTDMTITYVAVTITAPSPVQSYTGATPQ